MYSLFVGIDVSKPWIDVSYYLNHQVYYIGQFDNDNAGFKKVLKSLSKITEFPQSKWIVCFENTGTYSKGLVHYLYSQAIAFKEENALQISKSKGIKRGKDDKIDSGDIAKYIYLHRDIVELTKPEGSVVYKLKKLLSRRKLLVKQKTALQVSLNEQKSDYDPQEYQILLEQNKLLIDQYKILIKKTENQIVKLIKQNDQLNTNYQLIKSITGIGPIIAAYLIAFTENFTRFRNSRKFACYCGIAPFPNRSGKSFIGKTKVNHMANKMIKALLSNGANAAVQYDKEIGTYYHRKRAEGKSYGNAINAVKNKLIHRVFAVIDRQTPFVPLMNYK